jgi:hypothetical protein
LPFESASSRAALERAYFRWTLGGVGFGAATGFGAETGFGADPLAVGGAAGAGPAGEGRAATAGSFGGSGVATGSGAGCGSAPTAIDPGVGISCRLRMARNPSQPVTTATARTALTVTPTPTNLEDDVAGLRAGTARERAAGTRAGALTMAPFGAAFCGARDGAGRAGAALFA